MPLSAFEAGIFGKNSAISFEKIFQLCELLSTARPRDTGPRGVRASEIHGFELDPKTLEIHGFGPKALKMHGF